MSARDNLLAVTASEWSAAHELKLKEAVKQYPIILEWLVDTQSDTVADTLLNPIDFATSPTVVAAEQAYTKGRLSVLLELIGMISALSKQPASE
jgi:hypothetical protein